MADKERKKKTAYTPSKQTLDLTEKLLPDLKNIDVDEVVEICVKVRMISKSAGNRYGLSEGGWDEEHYSKEYIAARNADQNQLRGTFEVLEAGEDDEEKEELSPEQIKANKIMADKRRGRRI